MKKNNDRERFDYPFAVTPFEDGDFAGYRAFLIDIPSVESLGASSEEAIEGLAEAQAEWFAYAAAKSIRIPEPDPVFAQKAEYSGRVTLRIPRSLHRQVAQKAVLEGVSLNAYLNATIERGIHA
jgi:predicted HicB family RNase H-like nuclease